MKALQFRPASVAASSMRATTSASKVLCPMQEGNEIFLSETRGEKQEKIVGNSDPAAEAKHQ